MDDIKKFIVHMESQLATLYEDVAELKMFGSWPDGKYDTCKLASSQYE